MDIEKEREAFESWATDKFPIAGLGQFEKHNNGTYLQRSIRNMYEAWQAAKAQAVPDGLVLVERSKLLQILGSAVAINTNPKTKINLLVLIMIVLN